MTAPINTPDFARQAVTVLHLDAGQTELTGDSIPPWRRFPYWTFSFCMAGQGRIDFQADAAQFLSRPGHVSIGPADRAYRGAVISKTPGRYQWIHAQYEMFGFLDPLTCLELPHVLPRELSLKILKLGGQIINITRNRELAIFRQTVDLHYLGIALLKLLSDRFKWAGVPKTPPGALEALKPAMDALKLNIGHKVDIPALARSVAMSRPTFQRRFKQALRTTPYAFIEKLRMRAAATKLCRSDMSIDALSAELGYCDRFQFSKSFKRFYGLGPAQYRKNYFGLFDR